MTWNGSEKAKEGRKLGRGSALSSWVAVNQRPSLAA